MAMDRRAGAARHGGIPRADRARARVDRRHAEQERRLGRVRRRQRLRLSQPHSVCRSWRAARSADRGRHRALPVDAGATRRHCRSATRLPRARVDYLRAHAACRWKLVRPLGHELHLRHLVGAVRAQCRRRRSEARRKSARRRTGSCPFRTTTAAGARMARATSSTIAATSTRRARASQTAWALLGLMAAGDVDHPAVARGIDYLSQTQGGRRPLGGAALHRRRLPAHLLSALPRLCEILPALGDGALPQPQERQ